MTHIVAARTFTGEVVFEENATRAGNDPCRSGRKTETSIAAADCCQPAEPESAVFAEFRGIGTKALVLRKPIRRGCVLSVRITFFCAVASDSGHNALETSRKVLDWINL